MPRPSKLYSLVLSLITVALVKRLDRQMITDVLKGSRVLIERHEVARVQEPVRTYASSKIEFFAKYGRWPSQEEAIKFDKTIKRHPIVIGEPIE